MDRPHQDLLDLRPRRVCLIKPSSLGDVVHATPVLAALRAHWPEAHIAWVINRGLAPLVEHLPGLDEVIPFDRGLVGASVRGLSSMSRFSAELHRRRFNLTIDLQGLLRSGLMSLATGAPVRVGLNEAREGARLFYTHRIVVPSERTHAVDRLMQIPRAFGVPEAEPRFLSSIEPADRRWAQQQTAGLPRPRIAWNLGARWLTKRWPPEQFARVARLAVDELGAALIAVGAPEDRPLTDAFVKAVGRPVALDLCGKTSLPRLSAIAEQCDLFVSNDTGPLHLAAATGTPVLGIYTCTQPGRTGPYGPHARSIQSQIWCAGSCVKNCDRMECMTELDAQRVWAVVRMQLSSWRRREAPAA